MSGKEPFRASKLVGNHGQLDYRPKYADVIAN